MTILMYTDILVLGSVDKRVQATPYWFDLYFKMADPQRLKSHLDSF